jgi:hypothetical protein
LAARPAIVARSEGLKMEAMLWLRRHFVTAAEKQTPSDVTGPVTEWESGFRYFNPLRNALWACKVLRFANRDPWLDTARWLLSSRHSNGSFGEARDRGEVLEATAQAVMFLCRESPRRR